VEFYRKAQGRAEKSGSAMQQLKDLGGSLGNERGSISTMSGKVNNATKSDSFKKWFGDWEAYPENASKIVDEDGAPLVVYHGTGDKINEFSLKKATDKEGRKRGLGLGKGKIYLTGHSGIASLFAEQAPSRSLGKNPNVMPVYIDVKKPITENLYRQRFNQMHGFDLIGADITTAQRDEAISKLDKKLKSEGYDGIWSWTVMATLGK
jgi:hypothetical protein